MQDPRRLPADPPPLPRPEGGGPGPSAHVPVSARIHELLRAEITALVLPPGHVLSRPDLARRFGVSQSPVREALARLELEGLVAAYPQSRTVVTPISLARLREEHLLRVGVECEVVRRVALAPGPGTLSRLRGLLRMQEALVGDVEQIAFFRQLDEAFHEALFAAIGQQGLHRLVRGHCGNLARLRSLDLPRAGKMRGVLEGHRAVVEAVAAGDAAAAEAAMRLHLSGTMDRLGQILADNPGHFVRDGAGDAAAAGPAAADAAEGEAS